MENILLVVSLVLFIAFIIGMFKPSAVIKTGSPGRGKVLLFFFLPSFICFVTVGVLGNKKTEEALKNPEGVEELSLISKGYDKVPELLKDFKDLKKLSLRSNKIKNIDKTILAMPLLEELDLSSNPIEEIPDWITGLTNLKKLVLDKTKIDTIPPAVSSMVENISYNNTPFEERQLNAGKMAEKASEEESEGDIEGESFGDFAIRKLMGNEHGYKRSFKKGDLYYIKPVTKAQADSLGNFLVEAGFFNDDNKVSMQIIYNSAAEKPVYELRAITAKEMDEEIKNAFKLQALFISLRVFDGQPVDFHLCDDQFNTHTILSSAD
ncbi:leucine-rich repeat domain-containing protein [Reichenbachiella sp. MALMAid0571]|uniref:leucine-rich repeat domain-containing protein n=1 Tax=Reichenbachiella sp. MALMAid0571 TaxID=3143939 RepID=UPI0032DFA6A8